MIKVYYTVISDYEINDYLKQVSPNRLAKMSLHPKQQKVSIIAEFLAYYALENEGVNSSEINLEYGSFQAPHYHHKYDISISHSNNLVTVAIGDKNIGVDCQLIEERNTLIANRILTQEELNDVEVDAVNVTRMFCGKEAVMKLLKQGSKLGFKNINITNNLATYDGTQFDLSYNLLEVGDQLYQLAVAYQSDGDIPYMEIKQTDLLQRNLK